MVRINSGSELQRELRAYRLLDGVERARARLASTPLFVPLWARGDHLYTIGDSSTGLAISRLDSISLTVTASATLNDPGFGDGLTVSQVDISPDGTVLTVVHVRNHTHGFRRNMRLAAFDPTSLHVFFNTSVFDDESIAYLVAFGSTPAAPTVQVTDRGDGRFAVEWQPGTGATPMSYAIRVAPAGQPLPIAAIVAGTARSWDSTALAPGTFDIEVTAINSAGSSSARVRAVVVPTTPAAPLELAATTIDDVSRLTWQSNPDGAVPAGFIIEAAASSTTPFFEVDRVVLPELVATRVPTGTWLARVKAFTASGISGPSNVVSVTARPCTFAPSAPRELTSQVAERAVTLRWNFPAHGSAEHYVIEAGSISEASNLATLVTTNALPFIAAIAPPGIYFVRVRGQNACGVSATSNEIVVTVR